MNTQKLLTAITVLSFVGILGVGAVFVYMLSSGGRLPEVFPVTEAHQAYFELEIDDTTDIKLGDEVTASVYITTSGEPFNVALVSLDYHNDEFTAVNSSVQGLLNGEVQYVGDTRALPRRRIIVNQLINAVEGDPNFKLARNARTLAAKLKFKAKKDIPSGSTISLYEEPGGGFPSVKFCTNNTGPCVVVPKTETVSQTLSTKKTVTFTTFTKNGAATNSPATAAPTARPTTAPTTAPTARPTTAPTATPVTRADICEATFALLPFKQCGESPCTKDSDCEAGLVCAPVGYCAMPAFKTSCSPTNPTTTCCSAPPQEYQCVDLTPAAPAPKRGNSVTFTCEASGNAATHARFQVLMDNKTVSGPSDFIALNGSKKATWSYTLGNTATAGSYLVQCQVCKSANANDCRAWGKAQ